jgi:hypothetical protein
MQGHRVVLYPRCGEKDVTAQALGCTCLPALCAAESGAVHAHGKAQRQRAPCEGYPEKMFCPYVVVLG